MFLQVQYLEQVLFYRATQEQHGLAPVLPVEWVILPGPYAARVVHRPASSKSTRSLTLTGIPVANERLAAMPVRMLLAPSR